MTPNTTSTNSRPRRRILRKALLLLVIIAIAGGAYAFYLFNLPHRDVQATSTDAQVEVSALVQEFLTDASTANAKYLGEEGEGKVLEVHGLVRGVETDLNGQAVVLLESSDAPAGVRCSFTTTTNAQAAALIAGEAATIKGVIRAGASYDPDLELYEHVVLEKCAVVQSH
ncbi:MAG: hypothetical protein IPI81_03950 [Flavobacteriales bacterium]|nr:hypothetical protein [Flavobacteriales bacterium]MCC6937611.1 hypothetical protein [Flavobacteriales bacterium]